MNLTETTFVALAPCVRVTALSTAHDRFPQNLICVDRGALHATFAYFTGERFVYTVDEVNENYEVVS